jgi:toxin ParE1/3/4
MPELIVSPEADDDLIGIWLHIAEDRDPETADGVMDSLHEKFLLLAANPEIGRRRYDLAPRLRSLPERNYMIFYRPLTDGVEIARVLHGARDIEAIFAEGD